MATVPLTKEFIYPGTKLSSKTINQPAVILARVQSNNSADAWKIMWEDDSSVAEWAEVDILFKFDRILGDDEAPITKPSAVIAKTLSKEENDQAEMMRFFSTAGPNECKGCRAPLPCKFH